MQREFYNRFTSHIKHHPRKIANGEQLLGEYNGRGINFNLNTKNHEK